MWISTRDWINYTKKLRALSEIAAEKMQEYVRKNGFADTDALIAYANALVLKYGEGSAELACQMYDAIAEMEGAAVASAVPAEAPKYGEVAKAINGSLKQSPGGKLIEQVVSRLVKQQGADTTLQNAKRDGAYFAWVPHGDTCPYCVMIGAIGWQVAGNKTIKGNHAEHIHANCDCEFVVDFKGDLKVQGYDPDAIRENILKETYGDKWEDYSFDYDFLRKNARKADSGGRDQLNALRRKQYQEKKTVTGQTKDSISEYKSPFTSPKTPLTVNINLQRNHIVGTNEYTQRQMALNKKGQYGPSYIELSIEEIQELIDKYHGRGIIKKNADDSYGTSELIINNDIIVGTVVDNRNGNSAKTSVFKIHYGNKGTHIVPDYPSKKVKKGGIN